MWGRRLDNGLRHRSYRLNSSLTLLLRGLCLIWLLLRLLLARIALGRLWLLRLARVVHYTCIDYESPLKLLFTSLLLGLTLPFLCRGQWRLILLLLSRSLYMFL